MELQPTSGSLYRIRRKPVPQAFVSSISPTEQSQATNDSTDLQRKSLLSLTFGYWKQEILSHVIAFLAFIAIIIVLLISDDRPVQHTHGPLTTNTLVSIFTAILKSAMLLPVAEGIGELKWLWFGTANPVSDAELFDLASRGPLGSLRLLFRLSRNKLASLGALITVFALVIDPFTQLIIQYKDCAWPNGEVAMIHRTNNYTSYVVQTGPSTTPAFSIGAKMALAIYAGFLEDSGNATYGHDYTCPTGTCNFNTTSLTYNSLGMCSFIEDITSEAISSHNDRVWTLPSGLEVRTVTVGQISVVFEIGRTNNSGTQEDAPYYEVEALMLILECTGRESHSKCEQKPFAFRAGLQPCIQTFSNFSVSNGQLTQTLTSTINLPMIDTIGHYYSLAGNFPAFDNVDCTPSTKPSTIKTQATHRLKTSGKDYVVPQSIHWANNSDVNLTSSQDNLYYDPACAYELGPGPSFAIFSELDNFFGVIAETNNGTSLTQTIYGIRNIGRGIGVTQGSGWLERLFANGHVNLTSATEFMGGLADSITTAMRNHGNVENSRPLLGQALTDLTCIQVKWPWITLDAVLMVSATVFFIITTWRARTALRESGRSSWKSSSLPLLWCGLEDASRQKNGTFNNLRQMEQRSDMLQVKLVRLDDEQLEVGPSQLLTDNEQEEGNDEDNANAHMEIAATMQHRRQRTLRRRRRRWQSSHHHHRDNNEAPIGRWVLQEQMQVGRPEAQSIVSRWGVRMGSYQPI